MNSHTLGAAFYSKFPILSADFAIQEYPFEPESCGGLGRGGHAELESYSDGLKEAQAALWGRNVSLSPSLHLIRCYGSMSISVLCDV